MRDSRLIGYARANRQEMNDAERRIWYHIRYRALGPRFRRQHPIGPFIADFASIGVRLVIELDGSQHRDSTYDTRRDEYMRSQSWSVLRFWSWDVMQNLDGVLAGISDAVLLSPRGLSPLSKGGPAERSEDEGG